MLAFHKTESLRLNVGSGNKRIEGFTNVDLDGEADIHADVTDIPLPDNCADEIIAIHVLEHLERWNAPKALAEWYRLLKPGEILIIELPDIIKCCKNLLNNVRDEDSIHGIYGDPSQQNPLMCHRWGYTEKELTGLLEKAGFVDIESKQPHFHCGRKRYRDMRLEARKQK